jgi:hypothetical protein
LPEIIICSFSSCRITTDDPKTIHCIQEHIVPEAEGLILGKNSGGSNVKGSEVDGESGEETEEDEDDEVDLS